MTPCEVVRCRFLHKETEDVPYTLHFEPALTRKIDSALESEDWQGYVENSILSVGCFDTWDTFKTYGEGQYIDAYGSIWTQSDDIAHLDKPVLQTVGIDDYRMPGLETFCDDKKLADMRIRLETNPELYPVGNIGAGIYELTWRLLGVEDTLTAMISEPDTLHSIFDKLTGLLMHFIDTICMLPVEAVMLGDDWADQRGIMFGPARWRDMIKPYYRKIYEYIHKKGKLTITHSCGSVHKILPDLIDIGLDVLESVQPEAADMNPYELKREFGSDLAFWGGLGCQQAVTYYSPGQLRGEIRQLKEKMSVGGGYVLAPSKTLNNSIPIENALTILEEFTGFKP